MYSGLDQQSGSTTVLKWTCKSLRCIRGVSKLDVVLVQSDVFDGRTSFDWRSLSIWTFLCEKVEFYHCAQFFLSLFCISLNVSFLSVTQFFPIFTILIISFMSKVTFLQTFKFFVSFIFFTFFLGSLRCEIIENLAIQMFVKFSISVIDCLLRVDTVK